MRRILLVDDDVVTLKLMEIFLQDNYMVTAVASGSLALEYLSKNSVDLILLDYMMPGMDGPALFQRIRTDFPALLAPVVFLTGVADEDLVIKGLKLHPMDYLLKPVKKYALLERIGNIFLKAELERQGLA